jgi:hypothetical protein
MVTHNRMMGEGGGDYEIGLVETSKRALRLQHAMRISVAKMVLRVSEREREREILLVGEQQTSWHSGLEGRKVQTTT